MYKKEKIMMEMIIYIIKFIAWMVVLFYAPIIIFEYKDLLLARSCEESRKQKIRLLKLGLAAWVSLNICLFLYI